MTVSELKRETEKRQNLSQDYFTKKSMQFFGDSIRNYGVRSTTIKFGYSFERNGNQTDIDVWELYRKTPVKYGLMQSAYFRKTNFEEVFKIRASHLKTMTIALNILKRQNLI